MNHAELNICIKHYLEQDKTKSAIMLTAPWGAGKSYYLQNVLKPFLKESGKHCYIVSLYGINSIYDVNRDLYFEIKFSKLKPKKGIANTAFVSGKTILRSVSSAFGLNINLNEKDLSNLYTSINLKDKLIVFEDLERSGVDILDFLGYVNSLIEQDEVKVLLVANEEELINYQEEDPKNNEYNANISGQNRGRYYDSRNNEEKELKLTERSKEYLRVKEKSISDTLYYTGDLKEAVKNIASIFGNKQLSQLLNEDDINEITHIFKETKESNLRSFLLACQKTDDIFHCLVIDYDNDFKRTIFFGILIFVLKIRRGDEISWIGDNKLSYSLGSSKYPLFRFCFDYIVNHLTPDDKVSDYYDEFQNAKLYDYSVNQYFDEDISVILSFEVETEHNLIQAIINIENKLINGAVIPFYRYGLIANYLIFLTKYLKYDMSKCLGLLVNNLKNKGDRISDHHLFRFSMTIEDDVLRQKWEDVKNSMIKSLNPPENELFSFDYNHKNILAFCKKASIKKADLFGSKSFLKRLDVIKFTEMIFECTSLELYEIRMMFYDIYGAVNIGEFLGDDRISMEQLIQNLKHSKPNPNIDAIQRMNIEYLVSALESYVLKLS